MSAVTRYRLLGPVEVLRDARPVELGGPKQRAVLGRLLLDVGRVVSTDHLLDAAWGDDHPPSAEGSLQAHVSKLRKALRDDELATSPITRRGAGYLIDAGSAELDIVAFAADSTAAQAAVDDADWPAAVTAAQAALLLWRGPLLQEYADEEWVRVATARLAEQRTAVGLNLVTSLLGCARVNEALTRARQLGEEQPLNERAAWLFAVTLHRAGRTAEALDALREHTRRLDDELGLDAGPAVRDLQGGLLRQDPLLDTWPTAPARSVSTPAPDKPRTAIDPVPAPPSGTPEPGGPDDFVGRQRELAVVSELLRGPVADGVPWIVLTGAAGMGKSRLAEQVVRSWAARVVRAGCPEDEGVPAWWPVRQLLDSIGADAETLLTAPPDVDADSARYAVYDAVVRALRATLADGPLLVLVEDVHWADQATLRLLTHLAGSASDQLRGLLVLITARPGEGGPPVTRLLSTVARRTAARTLAVPPLAAREVAELARWVSGDELGDVEAQQLSTRTGGNPFFVCEYARLPEGERGAGAVPTAVRSVLGRRLAVLDADVLQVLRVAAVVGDMLDIDLLCRVARLDRDELADLLDEAADEQIIVQAPGNGSYVFVHALMREQILAGLSVTRRQRLHLRVAETIAGDGAAGADALTRRAANLVAAGPLADPAVVFAACRLAAQDGEQRWQPEAAATWWAHAITAFDLMPGDAAVDRDDLVVSRVAALARSGRAQTVLDVIEEALLDAVRRKRLDSVGRFASTLLRTSGSWPWAAHGDDPGPLLARLGGIETLVERHRPAHISVLAALAVGSCYDADPNVPDRLSQRAIDEADALVASVAAGNDPHAQQVAQDALADALLGRGLAFSGIAVRAVDSIRTLGRLPGLTQRTADLDAVIASGLRYLSHMALGDVSAAAEQAHFGAVHSDLLRLSTSRVQFRYAQVCLSLIRADDLAGVEAAARHTHALHRQTELYDSGAAHITLLALRWEQGRLTRDEFADVNPRMVPWAAAMCAAAQHAPDAVALIAAELDRFEPPNWLTHGRLTVLAHAVVDAGAAELAPALIERLTPFDTGIGNLGQAGVIGPVALALARLHLLLGDRDAARARLEQATAISRTARAGAWLLRCRALAVELDAGRDQVEVADIAAEARRRGMLGVARDVEALPVGP